MYSSRGRCIIIKENVYWACYSFGRTSRMILYYGGGNDNVLLWGEMTIIKYELIFFVQCKQITRMENALKFNN